MAAKPTSKTKEAEQSENKKDAPDNLTAGVLWDDSNMATHFANVVNIQSTLEQVDLFFGTNQTWDVAGSGQHVKVELANRIILSPHAAKRLMIALTGVMKEYETRNGELSIGAG